STDSGTSATDFITNDTTLTVSGTNGVLAAGSKIQVSSNGGTTWSDVTPASATTWSFDDTANPHTTSFSYTARVVDVAGNVGNIATQAVTIDTTAPTEAVAITAISTDTGTSASDFITSDTTLTVTGTNAALSPGNKIQISSNGGTTWFDVTPATATTWTFDDSANPHATSFSYTARVVDVAGNVGNTATQAVTIDTTAPTETVAISAISTDSGTSATDFKTNDTTLVVSGTNGSLPSGSRIQVSSDGATWSNVTQTTATTWTFDDTANPHTSSFTYSARVVDAAGNIGTPVTRAVVIDTSATLAIDNTLMGDNIFSDSEASSVPFSGTTTGVEAGRIVQVVLTDSVGMVFNTTATVGSDGRWTTAPVNLSSAAHGVIAIQANVTDESGNAASANSTQLQYITPIDITAIDQDTGISSTDYLTSDNELTVSGVADPGGTVTLTGPVRYYGETGAVDSNGDPVYGVITYNLNQPVTVNPDGTWSTALVFGNELPDVDGEPNSLIGTPIPLYDTGGGQPAYTLTATWSKAGGGTTNVTDTALVSIDTQAPDMFVQATGPTSARQVNTFIKNNQMASRTVGLADGGYVVVWTSIAQDGDSAGTNNVYGQIYDAYGNKLGSEFRVNTYRSFSQGRQSNDLVVNFDLVADPAGGFTVIWSSNIRAGSYDIDTPNTRAVGGHFNIMGQRYDASGQPITTDIDGAGSYGASNEFIVSSSFDGGDGDSRANVPRVTAIAGGGYVAVWSSNATKTNGYDVRAQVFNAAWERVGGEIKVTDDRFDQGWHADNGGDLSALSVTATAAGFKVVYEGVPAGAANNEAVNRNIYAIDYIVTSTGATLIPGVAQINTGTAFNQMTVSSTALTDGGTVVVWISSQTQKGIYDLYSQRLNADGTKNGAEARVNATLTGNQGTLSDITQQYSVTGLDNGSYVVVWAGRGPASATDDNIYMRVFSASGVPLSSNDILVNQSLKGIQQLPHVAALEGGGYIVTWSSQYAGTDQGADYAVMQRAYNNDGTPRPQAIDTPELLVNTGATTNSQYGSYVSTSYTNKNVAVAWVQRNSTGGYNSSATETTKAAVFDLAGRKVVDLQVADIAGEDGTFNSQSGNGAQILSLSDGKYVLVREANSPDSSGNVYASIYNANGTVFRPDFIATDATAGEQHGSSGLVELRDANGPTGKWAMLYLGKLTAGSSVQPKLAIINADGTDAGTDVEISNHGTANGGNQGFVGGLPGESTSDMAASNGKIAVVWSDATNSGAGPGDEVYLRLLDNNGVKLGSEIVVNQAHANNQSAPKVAALADGSFLVTWVSNHVASGSYKVYQQRFTSSGVAYSNVDELVSVGFAAGTQGVISGTNGERAQQIDVVGLEGGGWVVAFTDSTSITDRNVFANLYDAAGNLMRANIKLASGGEGTNEFYPTLAASSNGGFVATWTSNNATLGDSSGNGTYMRFFDEAGHVASYNEYQPAGTAVSIEPNLLIGGTPNANAYNIERGAADPTFDPATDGLSANGDTAATLWKAEVTILNYESGDVLAWDSALATSAGLTATYDGAGHLTLAIGSASTLAGIEAVLRSVTYSGGANPAAGDRTIEFSLTDKAGATTAQQSGITVDSPALALVGTGGNDVLTGGNGHDGIITNGGNDSVYAGNGDDRIYESNPALLGHYEGGQGFDTLVLDFTGARTVVLNSLDAHGIERIDLGNTTFKANSTDLHIDTYAGVKNMVDAGQNHFLVQGNTSDKVTLADATGFVKVGVTSQDAVYFDVYQAAGQDVQLWLQQGLAVTHV
ncbi:MAG: hypothetical protein EOO28_26640, partial [Comamonadaceae bacterium]